MPTEHGLTALNVRVAPLDVPPMAPFTDGEAGLLGLGLFVGTDLP